MKKLMNTARRLTLLGLIWIGTNTMTWAVEPPGLVGYQGILRGPNGHPQNGNFSMVFSFFDSEKGGVPLLVDSHTGTGAVHVEDGFFTLMLGGGVVTGPAGGVTAVLRTVASVYLQVEVNGQTLDPRIHVVSSFYALNTASLNGKTSSDFLDIGAGTQTKTGNLIMDGGGGGGTLTVSNGGDLMLNAPGSDLHVMGGSQLMVDAGSDLMVSGAGSDLHVQGGNLMVDGGGDLMVAGGAGSDLHVQGGSNVMVDSGSDLMVSGAGSDLHVQGGNLMVDGGGDLMVAGGAGSDLHVQGGSNVMVDSGSDLMVSGAGSDLHVQGGNLMVDGGGDLMVAGGAGSDLHVQGGSNVMVDSGSDLMVSGAGSDLHVQGGSNVMVDSGSDLMVTGAGSDLHVQGGNLMVDGGGDLMVAGGAGSDLHVQGGSNVMVDSGSDLMVSGAGSDLHVQGGNLMVDGGGDLMVAGGAGSDLHVQGGSNVMVDSGSDLMVSGAGSDLHVQGGNLMVDGGGDLMVAGGAGSDLHVQGGSNVMVDSGSDLMVSGAGSDLHVQGGNLMVDGGGDLMVAGGAGSDLHVQGGSNVMVDSGSDLMVTGAGSDLHVQGGNLMVDGGGDLMVAGGAGSDLHVQGGSNVMVDSGSDLMVSGAGSDLHVQGGNLMVDGGGDLMVAGGAGSDLHVQGGSNVMVDSGSDLMVSGAGSDLHVQGGNLMVDGGGDLMVAGGAGSDLHVQGGSNVMVDSGSDLMVSGAGSDLMVEDGSALFVDGGGDLKVMGGSNLHIQGGGQLSATGGVVTLDGADTSSISLHGGSNIMLESTTGSTVEIMGEASVIQVTGVGGRILVNDGKLRIAQSSATDSIILSNTSAQGNLITVMGGTTPTLRIGNGGPTEMNLFLGDSGTDETMVTGSFMVSGMKSFVQNHPLHDDLSVVYTAVEGDESATFNRGSARLVRGVARVALGETFKWVTNPDIGLTAHITPRGDSADLYVESITTSELVRGKGQASRNAAFDYIVYGLRNGYEDFNPVQPRVMDSPIPSETLESNDSQDPEIRSSSPRQRYQRMNEAIREGASVPSEDSSASADSPVDREDAEEVRPIQGSAPIDAQGNVYATSFRPSAPDLATRLNVSEPVSPGDVLVADRQGGGTMHRSDAAEDPAVVGIVSGAPGVILGGAGDAPSESADRSTPTPITAPVAVSGVVLCRVDASSAPIRVGDLLTTAATPGHAMRSHSAAPGTIVGKALEPLESGAGLIKVLVMLR